MSFPTRQPKVDPNAPKIPRWYYLGIVGSLLSMVIFVFILPQNLIIICGVVHIIVVLTLIVMFAISHTKKDIRYKKEKREATQQQREKDNTKRKIRMAQERLLDEQADKEYKELDGSKEALEAYKNKWEDYLLLGTPPKA